MNLVETTFRTCYQPAKLINIARWQQTLTPALICIDHYRSPGKSACFASEGFLPVEGQQTWVAESQEITANLKRISSHHPG